MDSTASNRRTDQRGASPLSGAYKSGWKGIVTAWLRGLPWKTAGLHAMLFGFWLSLLGGGAALVMMADRQIAGIVYQEAPKRIEQNALQARLTPFQDQSFFGVDLDALRDSLQSESWVESAHVYRIWPNTIGVALDEHVPAAHWGERGLISEKGELFYPKQPWQDAGLPRLDGRADRHQAVYARFKQWHRAFEDIGLVLTGLEQAESGGWTLTVQQGWRIELGRQNPNERLAIFMKNYERVLSANEAAIARVDMRYSRGMAVRWLPGLAPGSDNKTGS